MALPTATDLVTMDYAFGGQAFVSVDAKSAIVTTTLDYALGAQPFSGAGGSGGGGGGGSGARVQIFTMM